MLSQRGSTLSVKTIWAQEPPHPPPSAENCCMWEGAGRVTTSYILRAQSYNKFAINLMKPSEDDVWHSSTSIIILNIPILKCFYQITKRNWGNIEIFNVGKRQSIQNAGTLTALYPEYTYCVIEQLLFIVMNCWLQYRLQASCPPKNLNVF